MVWWARRLAFRKNSGGMVTQPMKGNGLKPHRKNDQGQDRQNDVEEALQRIGEAHRGVPEEHTHPRMDPAGPPVLQFAYEGRQVLRRFVLFMPIIHVSSLLSFPAGFRRDSAKNSAHKIHPDPAFVKFFLLKFRKNGTAIVHLKIFLCALHYIPPFFQEKR